MTNEEFLRRLEEALRGQLPPDELKDVMDYHREYFAEAGEDAAGELDPPEVIAKRVLEESGTVPQGEETGAVPQQEEITPILPPEESLAPIKEKKKRKRWPGWLIALVVVGAVIVTIIVTVCAVGGGVAFKIIDKFEIIDKNIGSIGDTIQSAVDQGTDGLGWPSFSDELTVAEEALPAFQKVDVKAGVCDVRLEAGERWYIHLEYYHDLGEVLTYQLVQDGPETTLKVTGQGGSGIADIRGGTLVITVPQGETLLEVEIESGVGDVNVTGLHIEEMDISAGTGGVTMRDCQITDQLECETGVGEILAVGEFPCKVKLVSGTGNITLSVSGNTASDYQMDIVGGLGDVFVDGVEAAHQYKRQGGPHRIEVECGLGDVTISF